MSNPYTHQPMLVLLALKKQTGNELVHARQAVKSARTYIGIEKNNPLVRYQARYDALAEKYQQIQDAIAGYDK